MPRISPYVSLAVVLILLVLVLYTAPGPANLRPSPLNLPTATAAEHTVLRPILRPLAARRARKECCNAGNVASAPKHVCENGVCRIILPGKKDEPAQSKAAASAPATPDAAGQQPALAAAPPSGENSAPPSGEKSAPPAVDSPAVAEQAPAKPAAPAVAATQPAAPAPAAPEKELPASTVDSPPAKLVWLTNYREAMDKAAAERKMLLVFFHDNCPTASRRAFEQVTLADPKVQKDLGRYVLVKLPLNTQIQRKGKKLTLLSHAAFAEMQNRQGLAVLDLAHPKADYYGYVVSTFPFTPGKYFRAEALRIVLDLPPGTLTQRTMIYAVRIHPEIPASTQGRLNPVLADEAKQHSLHQASITLQGHHSWDSRFHRINSQLPGGLLAQEVVAESWPNEGLVEACVDCVDSWRQSPGHWGAVRARHPFFGYDIKRGRNGIWYATGIFGRR